MPATRSTFSIGALSVARLTRCNCPRWPALVWNTVQLYTTGVLGLAAAGVPGDYNHNGTVDAADYVVWRKDRRHAGRLQHLARQLRRAGRQRRGGTVAERVGRRPRAVDAGDASSGGCGRVFTSTPGRIESPENSSTRETGQQSTDLETVWLGVPKAPQRRVSDLR